MKLKKWLEPMDTAGIFCNIWMQYIDREGNLQEDFMYAGSMWDIPYWLVDYKIAPNDENGEAISWVGRLRQNEDDEGGTPGLDGFCIYIQEKESEG